MDNELTRTELDEAARVSLLLGEEASVKAFDREARLSYEEPEALPPKPSMFRLGLFKLFGYPLPRR